STDHADPQFLGLFQLENIYTPIAVFSNAFTLLLKLWRFDQPPAEHGMGNAALGGEALTSSTSRSSDSSVSLAEDCTFRLKVPAWAILAVVPFVIDAALTVCTHRRLSPRELNGRVPLDVLTTVVSKGFLVPLKCVFPLQ
ncbi:mediator of RNA polymerase II transcription subunit 33A-like protein, partial [Tanacetum coccineum]